MKNLFSDFKKLTNLFIVLEFVVLLVFLIPFNSWIQFWVLMLGFIFSLAYCIFGINYYFKQRKG